MGRRLRKFSFRDLIDLLGVLLQMVASGTYVRRREKETAWKQPLNGQVPLLDVCAVMVRVVCLCYGLHNLRKKLLSADRSKATARRRENAVWKRQRDGSKRMNPIYCTCVGRAACIKHIVHGVERE